MLVLGIETSCDETAAAVVRDGREIVSSVIASQIATHTRFGGVVPELASREHLVKIVPIVEEAFTRANISQDDIDGIAVTVGPGLNSHRNSVNIILRNVRARERLFDNRNNLDEVLA